MTLLGMPPTRPVAGQVYRMPRDLYDPNDSKEHPLLVLSVDDARRIAIVVTRTSRPHAKGPLGVAHGADRSLRLDLPGWWRLHRPLHVPFHNFCDKDVRLLGKLDERTWAVTLRTLERREATS